MEKGEENEDITKHLYGGVAKVRLIKDDGEIQAISHYSQSHWGKAMIETLVKLENLGEPFITLVYVTDITFKALSIRLSIWLIPRFSPSLQIIILA